MYSTLKSRYPNYQPAIIVPDKDIIITKLKYLMPLDVNVGVVMTQIRKNIKTKQSEAIIFIIDDKVVSPTTMVMEIKRNDFVYIRLMKESVFGCLNK